jgi:hypothetical protein
MFPNTGLSQNNSAVMKGRPIEITSFPALPPYSKGFPNGQKMQVLFGMPISGLWQECHGIEICSRS